jgi:hypothetical protein
MRSKQLKSVKLLLLIVIIANVVSPQARQTTASILHTSADFISYD